MSNGFAVLRRRRNLQLLWVGRSTSALGDAVMPVALVFAALQVASLTGLGLVLAAELVPTIAFVLVGGVYADRLPRRTIMLSSDTLRALVQVVLFLLLLSHHLTYAELIFLTAVSGVGKAFFGPSFTGLLPALVEPDELQAANGLFGITSTTMDIAGPALAGVMIGLGGVSAPFAFNALTYAVSVITLALMRLPVTPIARKTARFLQDLAAGWREVTRHTWLWAGMTWYSTFFFFVIAPWQVLGPVIAKQSLGGAPAWAAITTALSAGGLAGGITAVIWRPRRRLLVPSVLMALEAAPVTMLAFKLPIVFIVIAQLAGGFSIGMFVSMWDTALDEHVPRERLSRVSAYDSLATLVMQPAGLLTAAPVAAAAGTADVLLWSAMFILLSTACYVCIPGVRSLPSVRAAPPENQLETSLPPAKTTDLPSST